MPENNIVEKLVCLLFGMVALSCVSCYNSVDSSVAYDLDVNTIDVKQKPIENWYVCGAFGPTNEVAGVETFNGDMSELEKLENPDTMNIYWYNGLYKPRYNLLDLREVFNYCCPIKIWN